MKNILKQLVKEHKTTFVFLIKKNEQLLKYIETEFNKIVENTENEYKVKLENVKLNLSSKIYLIINDYKTIPTCPICGKIKIEQNIISMNRGFSRCCSQVCSSKDPDRQNKIEETTLKKFGSKNFLSSEKGKKIKELWCKEHGVSNPFQLDWVNEKSKETRKLLYGVEYTMQSEEKRKLASENYLKKHGYDSQFHDPKVIEKIKETREEHIKNGFDEKQKYRENARKRRYKTLCENEKVIPNFSEHDFCKLDVHSQYKTILNWHCKECGSNFDSLLDQNFMSREHIPARCLKCHPLINNGVSKLENEVCDFISEECHVSIIKNDISLLNPQEIDIVDYKRKLCFEFDGLFWHSEINGGKGKYYHLSKTERCNKLGYRLIHIFEDEWINKNEIVKSRIKNMFGNYDFKVYGRQCEVKKVSSSDSMKFQNENHLQGSVGSKVSLGLYFKNELIALMTFGKPRFNKKYEWELLRFCCKLGYHVIGGASKLLKYFERKYNPKSIISYADRRWSNGNVYEKLGFEFICNSEPAYSYVRSQSRYNRVLFQKHKLKDKLMSYDENKTEKDNMLENGYDIIWDCGNMVFVKNCEM